MIGGVLPLLPRRTRGAEGLMADDRRGDPPSTTGRGSRGIRRGWCAEIPLSTLEREGGLEAESPIYYAEREEQEG